MFPPSFQPLVEYFLVPIGILLIAYTMNEQFRLKYSSGSDFYIFLVSLDLNAILIYPAYKERINPEFARDYLTVFVALIVICLSLLGFTLKTQGRIDGWKGGSINEYPFVRVFGCWVATMALIPTHLFVFFGR
jgi:hypothetical protein